MILDDALVSAGNEDEVLDAGLARLVDHVLDQRAVDQGEHLLRHRLGGGQEARAETGDGKDSLADRGHLGILEPARGTSPPWRLYTGCVKNRETLSGALWGGNNGLDLNRCRPFVSLHGRCCRSWPSRPRRWRRTTAIRNWRRSSQVPSARRVTNGAANRARPGIR